MGEVPCFLEEDHTGLGLVGVREAEVEASAVEGGHVYRDCHKVLCCCCCGLVLPVLLSLPCPNL